MDPQPTPLDGFSQLEERWFRLQLSDLMEASILEALVVMYMLLILMGH